MIKEKNILDSIETQLRLINKAKIDFGEEKSSQVDQLQQVYLGRSVSSFIPTKQFIILNAFIEKNPRATKMYIKDHPLDSLAQEEQQQYLEFVSQTTKKVIRDRIEELKTEINLDQAKENARNYNSNNTQSDIGQLSKKRPAPSSTSFVDRHKKRSISFNSEKEDIGKV